MKPNVYKRPDKPIKIPVRRRGEFTPLPKQETPEIVTVDKFTECHVTPLDVARRMVEYLGPVGDYLTLEPSAGTGNLVKALLDSGHSNSELTMIERHNTLASQLSRLGPVMNECFLEYASKYVGKIEFPRIIMNPPFRDVRKHVKAAISLMGQDGHNEPATLIALVPITFEHADAELLEILPTDTFATAKVRTKIIRIKRGIK